MIKRAISIPERERRSRSHDAHVKCSEDQRSSYPVGAIRGEESPLVGYAACSKVMCTYMIRRRNCNHVNGVDAIMGTQPCLLPIDGTLFISRGGAL